MSEKLFIVSNCRPIWDSQLKDLFIVDPYVHHVLERNDELKNYGGVEVKPYRRQSREDIKRDSDFVDAKYAKYIPIVAQRLNQINGTDYSVDFWRKALSLGFIRYITIFHNIFENIETNFDIGLHTCNILSELSYYTPIDFEDHRDCFQTSDFGVEQIASIYFQLFYGKKHFNSVQTNFSDKPNSDSIKITGFWRLKNIALLYFKKALRITPKTIRNKFRLVRAKLNVRNICVGICGSSFSNNNYDLLKRLSESKIHALDWNIPNDFEPGFNSESRKVLASIQEEFDRFDKFFFRSFEFCFPKAFIENFDIITQRFENKFKPFKNLKYIISEDWISDTNLSICLALNQQKGIKHITNEHNCFFHPYIGSFINHVARLSNEFVSMGWYDPKIKNMVKGASLFPFTIDKHSQKQIKILYISGSSITKIPQYVSHYGMDEEGVPKSLKFYKTFFRSLTTETIGEITYRRYPYDNYAIKCLYYDKEYLLRNYLVNVKEFADISVSGKEYMEQSDLIIIDYLSTSYIEAISMNIPTIVFHNSQTQYLNEDNKDFFAPLIRVGICQTDPVAAANLIEEVKDNPGHWWFSKEVQEGRNEFIEKNIGDPKIMIDYLLSLI